VLQSSPYIKDATISYRFPSQIVVKVDERTKAFAWKSGATTFDVADDGTVLGIAEGSPTGPTVVDADNRPLTAGDRVDNKVLEMVQQLRTELPNKVGLQGQEFRQSQTEGVSVTTANGLQIIFGTSEDWTSKLPVLRTVLDEGKKKGLSLQYIDLRLKNRPYFR
jgi:cell division septal protein FtsQ